MGQQKSEMNLACWNLAPHCRYRQRRATVTHLFPMHPFSIPLKTSETRKAFWCFQGVEKGCAGNEWVKLYVSSISSSNSKCLVHWFRRAMFIELNLIHQIRLTFVHSRVKLTSQNLARILPGLSLQLNNVETVNATYAITKSR